LPEMNLFWVEIIWIQTIHCFGPKTPSWWTCETFKAKLTFVQDAQTAYL
jgi:hypothetical protein